GEEPDRLGAAYADATDGDALAALIRALRVDAVLNAVDPRFVPTVFDACLRGGTTYLDMATTLSEQHPENPYSECGVKIADRQFERDQEWRDGRQPALAGMGGEPGVSDGAARDAAGQLFSGVDESSLPGRANLLVGGLNIAP